MPGDLIQTPQTRWIQGAYESVQRGNIIVLHGTVTPAAGNDRWTTFRREFTTAGYQVPNGQTLYVTDLAFYSSAGGVVHNLLYGDNDVGINAAAAPANAVTYDGLGLGNSPGWISQGGNSQARFTIYAAFPANKYPALFGTSAGVKHTVTLFGHLE